MSAAPLPSSGPSPRAFLRHPLGVPLDLIALRSGVPESVLGRCVDLSEAGVGAIVAGELGPSQHVAVELRLPQVGVPVRARAVVRYQSRLRCGLEFVGLSQDQRAMIRYWALRSAPATSQPHDRQWVPAARTASGPAQRTPTKPRRRPRLARRSLYFALTGVLALSGLGWWHWQRSWSELEQHISVRQPDSVKTSR